MSVRGKNPFEIFGLTPEIAGRLNDKDLFAVIRVMYRTLHKFYHPDRAPKKTSVGDLQDAAAAVELNLAFEKLDMHKDPDSYRSYLKAYRGRRRRGQAKRIAELEKRLEEQTEQQSSLADAYLKYLLRDLPWAAGQGGEPCRTPFQPTDIKLGLNDVAINQNIRSVSWSLGSNYKEIVFDALGTLFYRPVGRSKAFPANYIRLLGVVECSRLDILPLMDRVPPREGFFKSPALDSRYGIDGAPLQVLNTMSLEKFKTHCLPLLKPEFMERAYLFSIHRPIFENDGGISVEGVIVKVSKP